MDAKSDKGLDEGTAQRYLAAILADDPGLQVETVSVCASGFDSLALDINDAVICKFPRNPLAAKRLRCEAALLRMLDGRVSLPVPQMQIHPGPPLFSRHPKLRGEHLPPSAYAALDEAARGRLGAALGQFYAQLHGVSIKTARAAGARAAQKWLTANEIARLALPRLSAALQGPARDTLAAFAALPRDPLGQVYGFFDGHGWNMAFDFARGDLAGIYDFADSGIGERHRDFVYSSLISPNLTARIILEYERLTARQIDRARVTLLTGVHRLWELATAGDNLPDTQANAKAWFEPGTGFAHG